VKYSLNNHVFCYKFVLEEVKMKKTIFLIGYMGSGKSRIGKDLSDAISYSFYDLDNFISANEGLTINEIFKNNNELYFRTIEREYLKKLININENKVISLGGGTPCYNDNMNLILNTSNSESIYLNRSIDFLVERLNKKIFSRPLISHLKSKEELKEFVSKHLFERNQYYLKANKVLNTNNSKIDENIQELIHLLT